MDTQTILTIATHVITKNHRIGVSHSDHRTWYLQIRDVRESDRGWYMCQINTDPMKSQVGYLEVVGECLRACGSDLKAYIKALSLNMVDAGNRRSKEPLKFLGGFTKLRKVVISYVIFVPLSGLLSVRLAVRMEEIGSHWKVCHKIWHVKIFQKSVEKRKVSLKSDKNNGHFNKDVCTS